ncbi:MAG: sulfite exporter TauE/SafE family protein [Clostridiales Family XIII bacterium]|jgi:sulfite exporter TauE/SafE/copper chaperone CopZ|nr:sulfite exporter TauE/SafE family protein [Clostridiales Family XIII bacterium]
MGKTQQKTELRIGGMTCVNCQNRIERKLRNTRGVSAVRVSYTDGTARITHNADTVSPAEIAGVIEALGYKVIRGKRADRNAGAPERNKAIGVLIIVVALFGILKSVGATNVAKNFPLAEAGMGYGMILVIGLLTSVHCVAMCGGVNISQTIPGSSKPKRSRLTVFAPGLLYNLGRVVSYTIIGAIVGGVGSVIRFSGSFGGAVPLLAGAFMVIMGLNMLGIFRGLGRLVPRLPRGCAKKIDEGKERRTGPFIIGLLNGLMPCGPLQAMQLYALSAGSMAQGALSMLLFGVGTLPLMFGLGALSSALGKKFTGRVMTCGAALVIFLGLFMFANGMNLSGFSVPAFGPGSSPADAAADRTENGAQVVRTDLEPGSYPPIAVKAGLPVKWVINAEAGSLNGCNRTILIPEYGIRQNLTEGENVIEFEPGQTGTVAYSCWMGMIRSTITIA